MSERTPEIAVVLARASEHALALGWPAPAIEHLFLAILDDECMADALASAGVSVATLRLDVSRIARYAPKPAVPPDLGPWLAYVEGLSRQRGREALTIGFLLGQVLAASKAIVAVLANQKVSQVDVLEAISHGATRGAAAALPRARVVAGAGVGAPGEYRLVLHNDDFTTFPFVCEVLTRDLGMDAQGAAKLAVEVHARGRASTGRYGLSEAEKLVARVADKARAAGFPLRVTIQPVD